MKRSTSQWLVLLAIFGMVFSYGDWVGRGPHDINKAANKLDRPWKQMIWEVRPAEAGWNKEMCYKECAEMREQKAAECNQKYPGNRTMQTMCKNSLQSSENSCRRHCREMWGSSSRRRR